MDNPEGVTGLLGKLMSSAGNMLSLRYLENPYGSAQWTAESRAGGRDWKFIAHQGQVWLGS